jgi:hypothetical protein
MEKGEQANSETKSQSILPPEPVLARREPTISLLAKSPQNAECMKQVTSHLKTSSTHIPLSSQGKSSPQCVFSLCQIVLLKEDRFKQQPSPSFLETVLFSADCGPEIKELTCASDSGFRRWIQCLGEPSHR